MVNNTQMKTSRGKRFKHSFVQSNYITACWNWFLVLAGKAAEPVLTISVLYSCARLLPAVHIPVQIDNVVFVAQMVALDVGGLSLGKMAKAAQRAGNIPGATMADVTVEMPERFRMGGFFGIRTRKVFLFLHSLFPFFERLIRV